MDIPRPSTTARRRLRRIAYGAATLLALALITIGLARLEPAAPTLDRSMVWVDTVERGPMLRQVRGAGTLVPREILWIPAVSVGRVTRILALPGTPVDPDTILLELTNPQLELAALDAESKLKAAEADYASLRVKLESELLTLQATAAAVRSEHRQAVFQVEADEDLARDGLVAELTLKLSRVRAEELARRAEIEQRRVEISAEAAEARLAAQRARVDQLRAAAVHQRGLVEQLAVRAGAEGVLQQVQVEVGEQVAPGTNLARVAEPSRLKAQVRIAETQARDVQIGQPARIDTRNGIIPGRVARIDPAVQDGTVTVDVRLEGELPRGARPDLSVDGTIELERLGEVLHVGRPAFGQEEQSVGLFKLDEGGAGATRVPVRLGRSSVSTIEIVEGLNENDQVILSDMSAWDAYDRIRLK